MKPTTHIRTPRKELGVKLHTVRAKARIGRVSGTPALRLGLIINCFQQQQAGSQRYSSWMTP